MDRLFLKIFWKLATDYTDFHGLIRENPCNPWLFTKVYGNEFQIADFRLLKLKMLKF
jgi:hypothetical protein